MPSLIIQRFLENALWHRLSSKENDKKIEDLQDVQRKASGTKVILDIPIHLNPYEND